MQRRLYRRCAWRPLGIYHQHFAPSVTLPLYPSTAPDPDADPDGDAGADAGADAAAERACFLMDFWLMFWALLWVPSRSHESPQLNFSYATS